MTTVKDYLKKIDDVIEHGKFKDNWESLSEVKTPAWYASGRFGIFIHWGCYSYAATDNEWFPRQMYKPGTSSWDYRVKSFGEDGDYRNVVEKFNPQKFNAEEWISLFKSSGAKYVMPVCEHHDGVKMYKSELNRWNMYDLVGRDFDRELHAECDRQGLGFLCSSHRAEHYFFMNPARKNCPSSEVFDEKYRDLYGPAFLPDDKNDDCFNDKQNRKIVASKEWLEDWLASSCEMVDRNKPLAMYFDWWVCNSEFRPYMKKFVAYYYNRAAEWGKEVTVFYKLDALMRGCGTFDVERGQINGVSPEMWQCDTAIAKNSWGYTENNDFKTPYECITNLIDVVSKNGCLMLNVGPKADGTICDEERAVLLKIGEWLSANSEAIYDSKPFKVYGEGSTKENKAFCESFLYSDEEYRFTYKTGCIYVFPMSATQRNEFSVKRLCKGEDFGIMYDVKSISLLGHENAVEWNQTEKELLIKVLGDVDCTLPLCFKIKIN